MPRNKQKQKNPRTYARNRAQVSRRGNELVVESDGLYFLKLIVMIILGTFWVKFGSPIMVGSFVLNAIPVGLLVGLFLIWKLEKMQADRKIWYPVLIVTAVVSYFAPSGIVL